jgi:hypothetical protein
MGLLVTVLLVLLLLVTPWASAEPVTTIRNSGDPANRVDIAILGDGYTAGQLGLYASDVETFVTGLFAQEPFQEYRRYFNVHRVDVVSNQSGADHPERSPPVFRNTALDASYNCANIQRLICVDIGKVFDVVQRSLSFDERDVIIVIVNDPEYGGSGGAVAVASTNALVVELVLHELGHSFGLLADEYDTDPQLCENTLEPAEPNVTKESDRLRIKWNAGGGPPNGWIDATTPIPTQDTSAGVVGLYEGARYCVTGLFRPTFESKMRALNRPYEQVNSEQLVKRIYNWVSPIDSSEPLASTITLRSGDSQRFLVRTPEPLSGALNISWRVDGQLAGTGSEFLYSSAGLPSGPQTVEVTVQDLTAFVRDDPATVLIDSRAWTVTKDSAPLEPDTTIDSQPPLLSKSPNAIFTFSSSEAGSKFFCGLNGGPFMPCKSPKKYFRLPHGSHSFQVKASAHGISDSTPATYSWTIDRTRPDTTITTKPPAALTNVVDASFEFTSSEAAGAFNCKLNKNTFTPCTSPKLFSGLPSGKHTFWVAAVDAAGNLDKKAASYKWIIDTEPPETAIKTKPRLVTQDAGAKFTFSANERRSTFECRLDSAVFVLCSSPRMLSGLSAGPHTFEVRATDGAGNTDPTPASYSWTIQ